MKTLIWVIVGLVALNALFFSLYMKERSKNRRVVTMVTLKTDSLEAVIKETVDLWDAIDNSKIVYRDRVRYINSIAPIFDEDSLIISINQTLSNASTGNR